MVRVDENFEVDEKCNVVIRPEDFDRVDPKDAKIVGTVTDIVFKGVHFEICALVDGMEFVIHDYLSVRKCIFIVYLSTIIIQNLG